MAFGTEVSPQGGGRATFYGRLIVAAVAFMTPAAAQVEVAEPQRIQRPATSGPAQMSALCDAPVQEIATPAPLPRLVEALEQKRPIKALAIGSSSTVGVGSSSPNRNYPNQLMSLLKKSFDGLDVTMINKGVSGEVAAATAERIRSLVALDRPTLVLWQVGTNDALARVPVEDFSETMRSTLRWLKANEIDVVLVGLQYTPKVVKDDHYRAIRDALRQIADEEQVLHVRRYAAMEFLERVKGATLLAQDELHLNDSGYRCMAEHVAHSMVVSSFLKVKRRKTLTQ